MKNKQPVSINGIEFDALISEQRTLETTVPEYVTEDGFTVSDTIIFKPEKLSMVLFVTNTPVTWYERHKSSRDRVEEVCKKLEDLYFKGNPVKVVTSEKTYTNMAIESIAFNKSVEVGYAREIPISMKKIIVASAKTTTIPAKYGKSGSTKTSTGTSNTSKKSSGSSSSSSSSSSNKSNSSGKNTSSSKSGNNKKSSVLYGVSKTIGVIK